ncbi:hypothetical protein JQX13_36980 [Archangium violaceum]|uniref:hypothetical protein n=1 Tax=Archangium violaceum TaxID=83451 RepID=UPI00193AEA57|nr:hypothetical protein [Archangium violaceum]QRK05702.1 hypothetical protein JQX13_36980 [Archangium violaceum]
MTARREQDSSRSNALLAWVAAAAFVAAAAWPSVAGSEFPLVGLRPLSDPRAGWPLAGATVALAAFLSAPRWHSRRTLLACAAVTLALFLATVFFVAPAAALVFGFLTGNLVRENWRPERGGSAGGISPK